jgi:hypothetical protein
VPAQLRANARDNFQLDENPELIGPDISEIPIGQIFPTHARILLCWSPVDSSSASRKFVENLLRVSADELKDRTYQFLLSKYFSDTYNPVGKTGASIVTKLSRFF